MLEDWLMSIGTATRFVYYHYAERVSKSTLHFFSQLLIHQLGGSMEITSDCELTSWQPVA